MHIAIEKEAWSTDKPEINKKFSDDTFFRTNVSEFLSSFGDWLKEMSSNRRAFAPFNLDSTIDALVADRTIKKGWFAGKIDYAMFDDRLAKQSKGKTYNSSQQKLIKLFFETTEEILTSKFGLKN